MLDDQQETIHTYTIGHNVCCNTAPYPIEYDPGAHARHMDGPAALDSAHARRDAHGFKLQVVQEITNVG
jgi:hypothetical protein